MSSRSYSRRPYVVGNGYFAGRPFKPSYFRHRITNATSEVFNSVIRALKYAARGFRSYQNYRTRILFFCAKSDLRSRLEMPEEPKNSGLRQNRYIIIMC